MMKPIPKQLLLHSCTYERVTNNSWGEGYEESITLTNVLIQSVSMLKRSNTSDSITSATVMFYDCTNSLPQNVVFTEKSRITWNGKEMYIKEINTNYALSPSPHHIELLLA